GTPTGTVTFADGGVVMGTGTLTGGQASLTTSALSVGTHTVTAAYAASGNFAASTSSALGQVVTPAGATLFVDRANSSCTDFGTGTAAAPFCTINAAAQKATAGKTVSVAAGTYPEQVTVASSGTSTAPIVFTAASGATVTVTGGGNGFSVVGRSWVTIHGFTVTATTSRGISVTSSSNITIDGNHVTRVGQPASGLTAFGIHLNATTQSRVTNNTTDHNSDAGVHVVTNSNANVIAGNVSFANARGYIRAAAGIDVRDSTGNQVFSNTVHDNEDSGINAWTGSTNGSNVFYDNLSYANGDHGIDVHNAVDARVISNTVDGNYDSGIEMTTSTGSILANNISIDNGINSARTFGNIRVDSASAPTTTVNDDLIFLRVTGVMVDWNGVKYSSLAAFRTATGQESRGIEGDPRFASVTGANFHLLAGSPAIDAANSGAPNEPTVDFDGAGRYDDPATTNVGIGPIAYADRGAFEYRP
ncbi:MAG: right-handed parallel beta-helix repeat-containing protein, partial [Acidimicrobiia bacterium]|nr:right-handed parallel beta-helix repeat-containing protein [Acidimicrobiia bacterium]